jgi:uncharacterized membrane protein YfcA
VTNTLSLDALVKTFLKYQHVLVFLAPALFVALVVTAAPTQTADPGLDYWLEYWWLFPFFLLGATIVNTVGISGAALFVPFLIFIFPLFAFELSAETIVKVGLISESFGLSSSTLAFISYGLVDRRLAMALVGGALPFVVGGALLSFFIPEPVFQFLLALLLLLSAYTLLVTDVGHEEPGADDHDATPTAAADGGPAGPLPNDDAKLGPAGVATDGSGDVTRVDRDGNDYRYTRGGYLERFGVYGFGGVFQGLAGFGIAEIGIVSMLRSAIPVRIAIGTNHVVVATTAIIASLTHVFGGGIVGGHGINLASTPWNMVVFTVPATVLGGQLAPYVAAALDTGTLKRFIAGVFGAVATALFVLVGQALI